MSFWKWPTRNEPQPITPARSKRYVCNNDICDHSLVGEIAEKLRYGCYLCSPPTLFNDLPAETRKLIPLDNPSLLWPNSVPCPFHPDGVLRPFCSTDFFRIDKDGNIPPVGIYGFAYAGKTVFCAALMMELEKLFSMTGVLNDPLFDRGQYIDEVVTPLQSRGIVPQKTYGHRSLSLKLYRDGWFRKKVTFNDMGGENFEEWFSAKPTDELRRNMLEHLLHVKDAIFLMSPESASGLGAAVAPDLYNVVQRALLFLKDAGYLSQDDRPRIEDRLKKVNEIVTKNHYLFGRTGESLRPVAEQIAALVLAGDREDLVDQLETEFMNIDEQMKIRSFDDQLGGLIRFLDAWSKRRPEDNRFNQRLAITIGKSDLLRRTFSGDLDVVDSSAAHKSVQGWYAAINRLNDLRPTNSKNDWHKALKKASAAVRQILIDFGEGQFVELAERNFREVGYFFVSSLGRDTEPFIEWMRSAPQQPAGGSFSAMGNVGTPTTVHASRRAAQWTVGKQVIFSKGKHRRPEPENVLWPLLWMLTGA